MPRSEEPQRNRLLAALAAPEMQGLQAHLEPVILSVGQVLCESGERVGHAVFPTTAIVSLLHRLEGGGCAGVAVVGFEGMVGVCLLLGGDSMPNRAVVQCAGEGWRLPAQVLLEVMHRSSAWRRQLLRYTQALMVQIAQTAVCNRHHSLDQQLCRWLLTSLDRLEGADVVVTQELIAHMLGVRREGVTEAAGHLQQAGWIRYRRGRITVLNPEALLLRSCECYRLVQREYDRLLP
ncbi:Crp/Fnr family transcriptional regulator [Paracidovorax valerianellae]|uniref:cAMP-binding domain of CRP or a regulatory subunit of cAMP-dependent protein kinases n=1 Tax=Paracidovorax valerianellae TaxID=187868 RepID=A0A1G7EQR8_9BURK|nr:Crp/Fnr family transcriptional regulator [Paracidovorax valerianellae]MDA8445839.1 Crp/Fnr family transcriptional regulator [Paracidovorax valerianellae]SDE65907.1 cAMP-binding domain of CRP or a regulatory subunit of cAMP-dependent protein kinases [Paracidovorax valerianellae]